MIFSKYTVAIFLALLMTVPSFAGAVSSYRYMSDASLSLIKKKYGSRAKLRVERWSKNLNKYSLNENMTDNDKARFANNYFNRVRWDSDENHWGVEDYWATPIETLGTYVGDCEDFSIGKYFSLTTMGVDTNKLRITYVKALDLNLAHMVLAYYSTPNAEPLILDNINKTILPASQRKDLLPIYGFNGEGIWLAQSTKKLASGAGIEKSLPSWGKLNKRMRQELL